MLYQFLRHLLNPIQDFQKVGRAVQRADFGTRTARTGVRALPKTALSGVIALPCRALDLIQRGRVFQRGCVAEFFAEISGAHDRAHHFAFRVWYVAEEQNFLGSERFARLGGERVF